MRFWVKGLGLAFRVWPEEQQKFGWDSLSAVERNLLNPKTLNPPTPAQGFTLRADPLFMSEVDYEQPITICGFPKVRGTLLRSILRGSPYSGKLSTCPGLA